jgi:hypothetical protein
MKTSTALLGLAVTLVSLTGCDLLGGRGDGEKEAAGAKAQKDSSPATQGVGAQEKAGGGGRSAVPQLNEWAAVKEVTVKGSSSLGCETKMVREWLRVSCRGKNSTGGAPTTVVVHKGRRSDTFTYASAGVTSLVVPFEEGADIEATFSWTDVSHKLVARWPRGSAKPVVIGTFEGASSPLDNKACIECYEEADEVAARAQGKVCCTPPPCQSAAHCAGKKCCVGPLGGMCMSNCDMVNTTPTCATDAECPTAYGIKLVCRAHPSGVKNCQSP